MSVVFASAFIQDAACGDGGGGREEAFLLNEEGQGVGGVDHHNAEEQEEKKIMEEKEGSFGRGGGDLYQSFTTGRPLVSGIAKLNGRKVSR